MPTPGCWPLYCIFMLPAKQAATSRTVKIALQAYVATGLLDDAAPALRRMHRYLHNTQVRSTGASALVTLPASARSCTHLKLR